jgi:hypothetical protein
MTDIIEQIAETRPPFSSYRYRICRDGGAVEIFLRDLRGGCELVQVLASARRERPIFSRCSDFVTGGGLLLLGLRGAAAR